jgi:ABC-type transporter Mla subunit MlaD
MLNERSPTVSPYPLRSPPNAPSQQTLQGVPQQPSGATKSYLLEKVRALLPYLGEILRQNSVSTNGIVDKLSHLRENLDGIFDDAERELAQSGGENEGLRERLRAAQQLTRTVEVKRENAEARQRLAAQAAALQRENEQLQQDDLEARETLQDLSEENKKGLFVLETMRRETDALTRKNR